MESAVGVVYCFFFISSNLFFDEYFLAFSVDVNAGGGVGNEAAVEVIVAFCFLSGGCLRQSGCRPVEEEGCCALCSGGKSRFEEIRFVGSDDVGRGGIEADGFIEDAESVVGDGDVGCCGGVACVESFSACRCAGELVGQRVARSGDGEGVGVRGVGRGGVEQDGLFRSEVLSCADLLQGHGTVVSNFAHIVHMQRSVVGDGDRHGEAERCPFGSTDGDGHLGDFADVPLQASVRGGVVRAADELSDAGSSASAGVEIFGTVVLAADGPEQVVVVDVSQHEGFGPTLIDRHFHASHVVVSGEVGNIVVRVGVAEVVFILGILLHHPCRLGNASHAGVSDLEVSVAKVCAGVVAFRVVDGDAADDAAGEVGIVG